MIVVVLLVVVPYLGTLVSLALLPKGRPALIGIGIAGAVVGVILVLNDRAGEGGDGVTGFAATAALAAIVVAGLLQAVRYVAGAALPGWGYAVLVVLAAPLPFGVLNAMIGD